MHYKLKTLLVFFLLTGFSVFTQTTLTKNKGNEGITFLSKADSIEALLKNKDLHDTIRVRIMCQLSRELLNTSKYNRALDIAKNIFEFSTKINYKKGIASGYYYIGESYRYLAKYPESQNNYSTALKLYTDLKDNGGIADINIGTGRVNIHTGNYPLALKDYSNAVKISGELRDTIRLSRAYLGLGMLYKLMGNYTEAIGYQYRSLKLSEKKNYAKGIADAYQGIAFIYSLKGDPTQSLKYHMLCFDICKKTGDMNGLANSYTNIGIVHYSRGNYDEAIKNYEAGLEIRREIGDLQGVSESYSNIGIIYSLQNKYDEAIKQHNAALQIAEKIGYKYLIAMANTNIGDVYNRKGDFPTAIKYLKTGLSLNKEIGSRSLISLSYDLLAEVYEKDKDYKNAFEYYRLFKQSNDSILNEDNNTQVNKLQIEYETEKKQKAIESLEKTNQIKQKEIEVKRLTIFGLVAGIALLFISIVVLYQWNRSRQNKRLHSEAQKHQQEQLRAVVQTQEEERKRIAKDLHDGVGQLLAGLKLNIENISNDVSLSGTETKEKLRSSSKILDDAATEVRSMSHQMMPRVLSESGLVPAIEDLLNKNLGNTQMHYDFRQINMTERFSENIEIGLYRITQELLGNILKHANATEINISLYKNQSNIILMVEDNGKGFNFEESGKQGHGLMNIRSRAQLVNGEVSFSAGIEKGTIVSIRIPIS